ncbi:uncharacterized protein [Drosophila pseudoobscura]|uniref:No apical meristem-associated C-terminal domain-containing protein n=1 Tax=Drosophila pseudoobscura pseudoobscura TaxID=46245 RepID=B5DH38_DROPS|nr:uncharacterized protein LOC6903330 [Drosophila pseudoobscura]
MSYLLTEIALEMLGYKFYDTNGTFHLTNFQTNTALADTNPNEPSLEELIYSDEPRVNGKSTKGKKKEPAASTSKGLSAESAPMPLNNRRTPARALAKIMDYESDKICNQIRSRLAKSITKHNAANNETLLLECFQDETKMIQEDAIEIQNFRSYLENRLLLVDKRPYEKYTKTFGPE